MLSRPPPQLWRCSRLLRMLRRRRRIMPSSRGKIHGRLCSRHATRPNRVHLRCGRVVHLPLLPTPPRGEAVTFGYRPECACLERTSTSRTKHTCRRTRVRCVRAVMAGLKQWSSERNGTRIFATRLIHDCCGLNVRIDSAPLVLSRWANLAATKMPDSRGKPQQLRLPDETSYSTVFCENPSAILLRADPTKASELGGWAIKAQQERSLRVRTVHPRNAPESHLPNTIWAFRVAL
jgi:hypothetical protein